MSVVNRAAKLAFEVRRGGIIHGFRMAVGHLRFLAENIQRRPDPVYERRAKLYSDLNSRLNSIVAYGPFKGMIMAPEMSAGGADRAPMLLGIYEQEVLETLEVAARDSRVFIDVGAAEGYYAVGVLIAGWFVKTYCFEMRELGQQIIRRTASINGVPDDVVVYGMAQRGFFRGIPPEDLYGAVMLVDIEGAEFELIDSDALQALYSTTIIIEIHEWMVTDGESKLRQLIEVAQATHSVLSFRTGPRDPGQFDELKSHSDTDRWLLCSEDRPRLMQWLQLVPKQSIAPRKAVSGAG